MSTSKGFLFVAQVFSCGTSIPVMPTKVLGWAGFSGEW